MAASTKTTDAEDGLVDLAPHVMQPYLRLIRADRPVGVWLLFLPCLWGTIAARPEGMDAARFWILFVLFLVGSFVMRSAGCVWNDLIDRDLDRSVERTKDRPLASGAVKPEAAVALTVGLCLIGLVVLVQLGLSAILIGLASIVLVAAYPFMKRITWWPQLWLGLTFNWGILVGAAAVSGGVPVVAWLLYGAGVFWTLGYDTIYALQDVEDDALAGIKSSARRLGGGVRKGVAAFYTMMLLLIGCGFVVGGAGAWLWLLLFPAGHLAWQVRELDPGRSERNLRVFRANRTTGIMVALALLAL